MSTPLRLVANDVVDGRAVINRTDTGTIAFRSTVEGSDFTCGRCGALVIEGVHGDHLVDLVLICNACGSANESPGTSFEGLIGQPILVPVSLPVGVFRIAQAVALSPQSVFASALSVSAAGIPDSPLDAGPHA